MTRRSYEGTDRTASGSEIIERIPHTVCIFVCAPNARRGGATGYDAMDTHGRIRVRRVLDELVTAEGHANTLLAAHGPRCQEYLTADSRIRRLWAELQHVARRGDLEPRASPSRTTTSEGG